MDELAELEREKARLLGVREEEHAKDSKKRKIKVLRKEIKAMKQPKYVRVIKGVTKDSVVGVGMIFKAGAKKASPYVKQGFQNLAENSSRMMEDKPQRRVRKVTKRKAPKKRKVIRRVVRRRPREERNPFFPFG